jgi:predicted DNA-binding transcriptional regulator AlpA
MKNRKEHLSRSDVLAKFGVCVTTFRRWRKDNCFPEPVPVQGRWVYSRAEVEAWEATDAPEWIRRGMPKPEYPARAERRARMQEAVAA